MQPTDIFPQRLIEKGLPLGKYEWVKVRLDQAAQAGYFLIMEPTDIVGDQKAYAAYLDLFVFSQSMPYSEKVNVTWQLYSMSKALYQGLKIFKPTSKRCS